MVVHDKTGMMSTFVVALGDGAREARGDDTGRFQLALHLRHLALPLPILLLAVLLHLLWRAKRVLHGEVVSKALRNVSVCNETALPRFVASLLANDHLLLAPHDLLVQVNRAGVNLRVPLERVHYNLLFVVSVSPDDCEKRSYFTDGVRNHRNEVKPLLATPHRSG